MTEILSPREAARRSVHDGNSVALEGFTHLIPTAADHELIRQSRKDLTLIRTTPDLVYGLLIGAGCAKKLAFSWGGNPSVGSLYRLRDAVEKGWPQPLEIEEHSHVDLANAYTAGVSGLPFAVLRAYTGSDLPKVNPLIHSATCPFTGEVLTAASLVRSDVSVIHAQKADRKGNVLFRGILGMQKEAAPAVKRCTITVKEIANELDVPMNAYVLPNWALSAVCLMPGGTYPSCTHGYYERDNRFYQDWDPIARDRESFTTWIDGYIRGTEDFDVFQAKLTEGK